MALSARGLACQRGDRLLFDGIDLDLAAGEALWVQGANGSGKTSLLRLLCGLLLPTSGSVQWQGHDIGRLREDFHRELLYVGHASGVKDELSASENLLLGGRVAGRRVSARAAADALDRVGLSPVAELPCASLSQGQRRRVALARLHLPALPPLLVLDEPFTALDRQAAEALDDALADHLLEGRLVVYTTHQPVALRAVRLHHLNLDGALPC